MNYLIHTLHDFTRHTTIAENRSDRWMQRQRNIEKLVIKECESPRSPRFRAEITSKSNSRVFQQHAIEKKRKKKKKGRKKKQQRNVTLLTTTCVLATMKHKIREL